MRVNLINIYIMPKTRWKIYFTINSLPYGLAVEYLLFLVCQISIKIWFNTWLTVAYEYHLKSFEYDFVILAKFCEKKSINYKMFIYLLQLFAIAPTLARIFTFFFDCWICREGALLSAYEYFIYTLSHSVTLNHYLNLSLPGRKKHFHTPFVARCCCHRCFFVAVLSAVVVVVIAFDFWLHDLLALATKQK